LVAVIYFLTACVENSIEDEGFQIGIMSSAANEQSFYAWL
jgi:hypothetical protein